jgi:hypothetical protein
VVLVSAAAAFAAACGNTVFVDPDQALKESLVFTSVERLVVDNDERAYFEVHIGNRGALDRVRLYAEGPSIRFALPIDEAILQPCFDRETCISVTLGPGVPMDVDHLALEMPEIGYRTSARLAIARLGGYDFAGESRSNNHAVELHIDDPIRRHYSALEPSNTLDADGNPVASRSILLFPRAFEAIAAPGACSIPAGPKATGWTLETANPFNIDAAFSDGSNPLTCVSVRPSLPKDGNAVGALTIGARAVVTRFQHVYTPPVEISPLVFMILFDLELPTEQRCTEAEDLVRSSIMDAATDLAADAANGGIGGAEIMMLDPIQIANAGGVLCHQANDRAFDGDATQQAVESALNARFGAVRRIRVVFVYASNLNLAVPPDLVSEVNILRAGFNGSTHPNHRDLFLGIAPSKPLMFLSPDRSMDWLATDEPSFRGAIKELLKNLWPFKTVVHTDQTVVPLIENEEKGRFRAYRICSASEAIRPLGTRREGLSAIDVGPDGPAYTVSLPPEVLVESLGFAAPSVTVDWEGCEGLCDLPAEGTDASIPWERAPGCS